MHDLQKEFTKDNIDTFLKEFAKEYKKQYGKYNEIDIILVGGAAVLTNYNFRAMTTDIDAYSSRKHAVKEISNRLSDKLDLPYDWFNSDFENTKSFTPKLIKYAKPYRTFSNVVHFYTISQEYLIAMKLMSGREYKNDLSDVAEIIYEHKSSGNAISLERIEKAIFDLYDRFQLYK